MSLVTAAAIAVPSSSESPASFSSAGDDLAGFHQQLSALSSTIELLLSNINQETESIEKELLMIYDQFTRYNKVLVRANEEVRHLGSVDKRLWIDLSRAHRTMLRELRNEFEWKRCSLQTAITQQNEAKQQQRRDEYDNAGDGDSKSKSSSHLIIIPPMNAATSYLPELIRTPVFYEIATPSSVSPPLSSSSASSASSTSINHNSTVVRSGSGSPASPNLQPGASSTSTTLSSTVSIDASPIGSAISTTNSTTSRFDHNAAPSKHNHTRKNQFATDTDGASNTTLVSVTNNRGEGATTDEAKRSWNEQINARIAALRKEKISKQQFSQTERGQREREDGENECLTNV